MTHPIELQHVNVKVFVDGQLGVDLDDFIKVFHRWTSEQCLDELLIDVADYRHVPNGPGVVLVGHEADYAIDHARGRYGVLYNRKAPIDGTNADRIRQALEAALGACELLENEFPGRLAFDRSQLEIFVNDRALAPNTAETFAAVQPDIESTLQGLGHAGVTLTHSSSEDPRTRFGVLVQLEAGALAG